MGSFLCVNFEYGLSYEEKKEITKKIEEIKGVWYTKDITQMDDESIAKREISLKIGQMILDKFLDK